MKRPLLLGIDASRSTREHPTGVERYSNEILAALLPELKAFEVRLYTPQLIPGFPQKLQRVLRFPRLWTLVRLSWEMLWHKPDLLFVPAHVLPFFAPRRSFVTIHDVAFRKIPSAYGWLHRWYLQWSTRRAVRRCEQIFVPTEAVAADVKRFFGARHVVVVPHGPLILPRVEVQRSSTPLFFFIGRLEAKKNLEILLEAWKMVRKKCGGHLVLAGGGSLPVQATPGVVLPGFISETEASRLFHSATAFVFPSLEEGFGFPLLQAFSADCPVLCSDIPALREVGSGAALYAPAKDAAAFAEQMLRLAQEPELRASLVQKGHERLQHFSWGKAAEELLRFFRA